MSRSNDSWFYSLPREEQDILRAQHARLIIRVPCRGCGLPTVVSSYECFVTKVVCDECADKGITTYSRQSV